ncbi:MAG: SRPBCC family protein [Cyanobacteria bacterium SZAS LIN-2]|nr:SRPBCC family protein [Cyanobacteria bacterium SZAS LIN-3]MBS1999520.1 SRPBCC family protein [Cyanobacteria bacterium SZAS LIN-2]MBS2011020.1 SRPBCC family protein [Cyanobacteria bacterium SZAS TMP-1]
MANLKQAVAVFSLAASAVISPCALQSENCVFPSQAAYAKVHGAETIGEEQMHGKTYVVARVTVKAPPEKVFQILSDYDHADKVFPQVKRCKLVSEKGTSKVVKHEIAPSGMPGTYEYMLDIKETAPHALEWHRISGDFKQVDGYWKLDPTEGGHATLVTYASYVDGGMFIPQLLIRRQSKIDMAGVVNTLKAQAEANACSVQIAGRPDHHGTHHVQ